MQRYLVQRLWQGSLPLLAISAIVFLLARWSGNPLDVMLPDEATDEDYRRVARHWGLDKPLPDISANLLYGFEQFIVQSHQAAPFRRSPQSPCHQRGMKPILTPEVGPSHGS